MMLAVGAEAGALVGFGAEEEWDAVERVPTLMSFIFSTRQNRRQPIGVGKIHRSARFTCEL
jgi:hypothetical protein